MTPTLLELFSGTSSIGKIARQRGWRVISVDILPIYKPTILADVLDLNASSFPNQIDVIWASPPCNCFTKMSCGKHFLYGLPYTEEAKRALALVKHTLHLIRSLSPQLWYIENPVGMLRRQYCMSAFTRHTVTYCQYGLSYRKPTDIWTNDKLWQPRPACNIHDNCHEPDGIRMQEKWLRMILPPRLCREILESAEIQLRMYYSSPSNNNGRPDGT